MAAAICWRCCGFFFCLQGSTKLQYKKCLSAFCVHFYVFFVYIRYCVCVFLIIHVSVYMHAFTCWCLRCFMCIFECLYVCMQCLSTLFVCVYVPPCVNTACVFLFVLLCVCFQCFLVVTVTQYPSVLLGATTDSKVSFVLWWLLYKSKCTHSVSENSSLFIVLYESGAGWFLSSLSLLCPRPPCFKIHNKLSCSAVWQSGICVGGTSEETLTCH